LIDSLSQQYWRALNEPSTTFSDEEWVAPADFTDLAMSPADEPNPASNEIDSIEEWLGGPMNVDAAFGPLDSGDLFELASGDPVPDILRVFAPPEFLAAESRKASPLPPALTRREHHALSVDSPFVAPVRHESATPLPMPDAAVPHELDPSPRPMTPSPALTIHSPFRPPIYGEPS